MRFLFIFSVFLILTVVSLKNSDGYRILGVFPVNIRSHFMMFEALSKGLARKGHQVDVISNFPQKKPYANYTDLIVLPRLISFTNNVSYDHVKVNVNSMTQYLSKVVGNDLCRFLGHPELLKLVKNPPKDPPYDLVMTQVLCASCFMALGHAFKVPVVGLSSAVFYPWHHAFTANPLNLAFVPNNLINYNAPMTFWQRLHNTVDAILSDYYFRSITSVQDEMIKKYLGDDAPSVREAERSMALVLVNSHPSLNGPKPTTPAVIEVGGLHISTDSAELPQNLKDWMDNSTHGFIYFSFGSMFLIETFPVKLIQIFYKSLGKIAPIRVLMKVPKPHLLPPGLPENFLTFKWAPQSKVLGHKNVKAFISHGGLMGLQEAIYSRVPIIGIPLIVDQFLNIDAFEKMKIAVKLKTSDLTEEKMDAALNEILYNPLYKNTIEYLSIKFQDRPMTPMDTATWWVEYAVRHGNKALRSPALDLHWWQVELLDIYAFILFTTLLIIYIKIKFVQFCIKKIRGIRNSKIIHDKKE